jgi:hypothetical protein
MRDIVRVMAGDELATIRSTSSHLAEDYPWMAESGFIDPRTNRKVVGLPVGYCGKRGEGGIFGFDHIQYYNAGLIQDVNVIRMGLVGNWKSAGVKSEIWLGSKVGYNQMVMDVKGEYTPLAGIIDGSKILRFGAGSDLSISPLDPSMDPGTRYQLLEAMLLNALTPRQTELDLFQEAVLEGAINEVIGVKNDAEARGRVATLPELVEFLAVPSDTLVQDLRLDKPEVEAICNKLRLALRKYTTGQLAGPFSGTTTPGIFEPTPLLVLNCENMNKDLAAVTLIMLSFLTQSKWGRQGNLHFHKVYYDEVWDLASYPGYLESLVRAFKLGGTWGVSNNIILHHLSNLNFMNKHDLAESLIADSSTRIIYGQKRNEIEPNMKALNLNQTEVNQICRFEPGQAMYKVRDLPGVVVNHTVSGWPMLRSIVETRHRLKGMEA